MTKKITETSKIKLEDKLVADNDKLNCKQISKGRMFRKELITSEVHSLQQNENQFDVLMERSSNIDTDSFSL